MHSFQQTERPPQVGFFSGARARIGSHSSLGDLTQLDSQREELLASTLASPVVPADEAFIGQHLLQAVLGLHLAAYQSTQQRRQCHPWLEAAVWKWQTDLCRNHQQFVAKINEFLQDAATVRVTLGNFIPNRSRLVQTLTQLLSFITTDVELYRCRVWCGLRAEYAKLISPIQQQLQARVIEIAEVITKIDVLGRGNLAEVQDYKRQLKELTELAQQVCVSSDTQAMLLRHRNLHQEKREMNKKLEYAHRVAYCVNHLHAELSRKPLVQPYHEITDQQLSNEIGTIEQVRAQCQAYLHRVIANQGTDTFIENYATYYEQKPNYAALAIYVLLQMTINRADKLCAVQDPELKKGIILCEEQLPTAAQYSTLSWSQLKEILKAIVQLRKIVISDEKAVTQAYTRLVKVFEQGQSERFFLTAIFIAVNYNLRIGAKALVKLLLEYKETVQQTYYSGDGKLMVSIEVAIQQLKTTELTGENYKELMKFACQTHSELFPERIEGKTLFFTIVAGERQRYTVDVVGVESIPVKRIEPAGW